MIEERETREPLLIELRTRAAAGGVCKWNLEAGRGSYRICLMCLRFIYAVGFRRRAAACALFCVVDSRLYTIMYKTSRSLVSGSRWNLQAGRQPRTGSGAQAHLAGRPCTFWRPQLPRSLVPRLPWTKIQGSRELSPPVRSVKTRAVRPLASQPQSRRFEKKLGGQGRV